MTFTQSTVSEVKFEEGKKITFSFILWFSYLLGTLVSTILFPWDNLAFLNLDIPYEYVSFTLRIEELNCNPSLELMKCVLSELFSWVMCT